VEILVVIPTYNEAANIAQLLGAIFSLGLDLGVLVVDDASPDGTGAMVRDLGVAYAGLHLLERTAKFGLGSAYVEGFSWGLANTDAALLAQMDADFSHDPEALPGLAALARPGAVAIGSRYVPGGRVVNWGLGRRLLSRGGSLYARTVLGLPIKDVTGGFKCWPRSVLQGIGLDQVVSDGYAFQVEMSWRAWRLGAELREMPVTFLDRRVGQSKMTLGIGLEALGLVWTLRRQERRQGLRQHG
jgi:dolichol-phosphate mannosyltransferase